MGKFGRAMGGGVTEGGGGAWAFCRTGAAYDSRMQHCINPAAHKQGAPRPSPLGNHMPCSTPTVRLVASGLCPYREIAVISRLDWQFTIGQFPRAVGTQVFAN